MKSNDLDFNQTSLRDGLKIKLNSKTNVLDFNQTSLRDEKQRNEQWNYIQLFTTLLFTATISKHTGRLNNHTYLNLTNLKHKTYPRNPRIMLLETGMS